MSVRLVPFPTSSGLSPPPLRTLLKSFVFFPPSLSLITKLFLPFLCFHFGVLQMEGVSDIDSLPPFPLQNPALDVSQTAHLCARVLVSSDSPQELPPIALNCCPLNVIIALVAPPSSRVPFNSPRPSLLVGTPAPFREDSYRYPLPPFPVFVLHLFV